jgi:glycosyltransferase involved in cell wall biosynthesis
VPTGLIFNIPTKKHEPQFLENEFQSRPFFLYPAQLWPHKRHALLINAFSEVRKQYPNINLVLTGSDKGNREYLEKLRDDLGLTDSIHFLGFVSDERLITLMQNAHYLVFPSSLGPSNLPPLEAAMLGTPSLISNVHQDPALENQFVTVVPQQIVEDWANAMISTLSNESIVREPISLLTTDISKVVSLAFNSFSESRIEWK